MITDVMNGPVTISGPEGRIEARYYQSKRPNAPIAIVLHPHPKHGGTMNNKVVFCLYRTLIERGFNVIRFNFRGVGRSEGIFAHGEGELSDAATVLDWVQARNPNASACWVAGFSFGAWISMQLLMRRPEIDRFISISPPANLYDFTFLAPCPVPGLVVQGTADEIVDHESVDTLVQKLISQRGLTIDLKTIEDADHFFTNRLNEITQTVNTYIDQHLISKLQLAG